MERKTVIFIILILLFGIFYYNLTTPINQEKVKVIRVIDGDTVELDNNLKVRLIGINTPEKNEPLYDDAKVFLENKIGSNQIYLVKMGVDRYNRILGYLFSNNQNLNEEILKEGLGHLYYYETDDFYKTLQRAENKARVNEQGIWSRSNYSSCITLVRLDYYDKGNDSELLEIENSCDSAIEVIIKDDATHIFKETLNPGIFQKEFKNTFNDDKDTLYIWDKEGKLILYYRYPN